MEIIASGGGEQRSRDKSIFDIRIWDISTSTLVTSLAGHVGVVSHVCFNASGSQLASSSSDRSIIIWDCETWTRLITLTGHMASVVFVVFNATGDRVLSTSSDKTVRIWNLETSTESLCITPEPPSDYRSNASFNPSGDVVAVTCGRLVNIYDAHSGLLQRSFSGHGGVIRTLVFSRDGDVIVTGSSDSSVIIWEFISGNQLRKIECMFNLTCLRLNSDASRLVTSSSDTMAEVWDVATGDKLLDLVGHSFFVSSCCFSDDGSKVITGSCDARVKVWDSYTGEELLSLDCHGAVETVAYRPCNAGSYI